MSKERSKNKNDRALGKTYSIRFRFLATVIFAMLAVSIFIGGLSIYEVDTYILDQSENFVRVTCVNEWEQINDSLANMEKSAKVMESYLMEFFKSKEDVSDRELQKTVIKNADKMFVDVAKHTSTAGAVSYYFRLDPEISDSKAGLFYSKTGGGNEFISFEPTDISAYDKDDVEHVGWFWQPYEAKEPVWMKPYYNQNNGILMISYVIPMYYEDKFIGVVGMDFDYMSLENQVKEIKVYDHGFAHLEMDGAVISGNSTDIDPEDYLSVSQELVNGMSLVISASYDDIRQIRYEIGFKILLVVTVLFSVFTALTAYAVKRICDPLKKLTNAATELADGNYDTEIEESNTREIKLLGAAFENMMIRLREREETLKLSANRDSMTGLRNTTSYSAWISQFDEKIANGEVDFGVVMLDLNDLKRTNDEYGHNMGDKLIIETASIISEVFGESPVFRIGGDEFLVVLQNEALEKHEELFEFLNSKCQNASISDMKYPIGIAIGFSRFERGKDTQFSDVFKRADRSMYENKRLAKSES